MIKRRRVVIVLPVALATAFFVVLFLGLKSNPATHAAVTLKPLVKGIVSQRTLNLDHPYVDYVTTGPSLTWASLEPTDQYFAGPGWGIIDGLIANPKIKGIRLRVFAGDRSPDFVKRIGGAPISSPEFDCSQSGGIAVVNQFDSTPATGTYAGGCIPYFWTAGYMAQYRQLMTEIARRYEGEPKILDVVDSGCMTTYAEPLYRAHADAASNGRLWSAGLRSTNDLACQNNALAVHQTAFTTTRVSLAINPWDIVTDPATSSTGVTTSWSATYNFVTSWRTTLGARLVLQNNGWGATEGCPTGKTSATNYLCYLASAGQPVGYQSRTAQRLADAAGGSFTTGWSNALEHAISAGACFVESTDNHYTTADATLGAQYDRRLEANCGETTTPTPRPSVSPAPSPVVLSTPAPLVGDLNGDGHVNILDLSILASHWGTANASSDLNHDGLVNILDLSILLGGWTG